MERDTQDETQDVDPREFVRAMLGISPEDAEKVRDRTPGARGKPEKQRQEGPSADYGDANPPAG